MSIRYRSSDIKDVNPRPGKRATYVPGNIGRREIGPGIDYSKGVTNRQELDGLEVVNQTIITKDLHPERVNKGHWVFLDTSDQTKPTFHGLVDLNIKLAEMQDPTHKNYEPDLNIAYIMDNFALWGVLLNAEGVQRRKNRPRDPTVHTTSISGRISCLDYWSTKGNSIKGGSHCYFKIERVHVKESKIHFHRNINRYAFEGGEDMATPLNFPLIRGPQISFIWQVVPYFCDSLLGLADTLSEAPDGSYYRSGFWYACTVHEHTFAVVQNSGYEVRGKYTTSRDASKLAITNDYFPIEVYAMPAGRRFVL